ncbi:glycoside hydrolase family 71 protein [Mycena olivaceomarginata]|nr:glycoside hydrolase family 71 protein [Mycena olivaceomarginata]
MLATAFIRAFHLGLLLAGAVLALDHPIEQGEPAISRASPFLAHNPASPPSARSSRLVERTNEKYVFAQFIEIVAPWAAADLFRQGFFDNVDFKVFISFDSAYWRNEGKYQHNGSIRAKLRDTTWTGDRFPYRTLESQLEDGLKLFACPNWEPDSFVNNDDTNGPDCGMSWNAAWPNNYNQPIDANITIALDQEYINNLGGRPYMMRAYFQYLDPYRPGSPSTHYGDDTYNKNWIFYSDWLYQSRWDEVLHLQPQFVEILTRNDFGESHYIGPLHDDDWSVYAGGSGDTGASRWVNQIPPRCVERRRESIHLGIQVRRFLAYCDGKNSPAAVLKGWYLRFPQTDKLVYYYRPTPKDTPCSDDIGRPNGWQYDDDLVFVIAMLVSPGTVTIASGSENAPVQFQLDAGIHTVAAPMGLGKQSFALWSETADISGDGGRGTRVYNFNAYVGSVVAWFRCFTQ